jgi:RNA polymerase sigma factor (sigma-70 family)
LWPSIEPMAQMLVLKALRTHEFFSSGHAKDLLQEAMIAVYEAIEDYGGRAEFSTYAYQVIWNRLVDYMHREGRWDNHIADQPIDDETFTGGQSPATSRDEWMSLMHALATTPNADILLLHATGYTDRELEPRYGPHVKMKRYRARKSLAQALRL